MTAIGARKVSYLEKNFYECKNEMFQAKEEIQWI